MRSEIQNIKAHFYVVFSALLLPRPSKAKISSSVPHFRKRSAYISPSIWGTKFQEPYKPTCQIPYPFSILSAVVKDVRFRGFIEYFVTWLFTQMGGSPCVGCKRLLIEYILSYPPTPYLECSQKPERHKVVQSKCLRIATGAPWYISNRKIHEDLGVPSFADHIRALTESFDWKLADAGNPLIRQLDRYLTDGWSKSPEAQALEIYGVFL